MPPPLPSKLITRANGRNGKPPTMPPPLPNSTSAGPPPLPVREEMPAELAEKKRALELLALFTPYSKQHKLDPDTIATTIRMFDLEGEGELRQFLKIVLKMQAIFRRKLAWKQLVLDSFNMEDSEDDEDGFGVDEASAAAVAAAPISFNARDGAMMPAELAVVSTTADRVDDAEVSHQRDQAERSTLTTALSRHLESQPTIKRVGVQNRVREAARMLVKVERMVQVSLTHLVLAAAQHASLGSSWWLASIGLH